jgi:hypothetical protein
MNLATLPAAYARPDSNGPRRGRSSTIPFFPERNTSTAIAPEQAMIEQHKHRIFSSFRTVFSFKLPLRLEFEMLKRTWKGATRFHSSVSYMTSHPAYQRIIGMGWAAVPLILGALRRKPDFWFEALLAITGEQPVPKRHAGDMRAMTEDWLKWGRSNGYDC